MYSIGWNCKKTKSNVLEVCVTLLDEGGRVRRVTREYTNWIGVCTDRIDRVTGVIRDKFPRESVTYVRLGETQKILPYLEERLATGKLDYRSKSFYKVYTTAPHEDVGRLFRRYEVGYFDEEDWLVRIYIDFCTRFDTRSFYYRWYAVAKDTRNLLDSFRMLPDRRDAPDWTVAAFDLETVPLVGNHLPVGHFPTDRIVMISVCKWNRRKGVRHFLLYLLPRGMEALPGYPLAYRTETEMMNDFHHVIGDAQVLTGYNIDAFDLPCLFARMVWTRQNHLLSHYTSRSLGRDHVVTTFRDKLTVDLYSYFKTFSGYDLPSFKLDDVARVKLGGGDDASKVAVKSTGIWSWYRCRDLTPEVFASDDVRECFRHLKPAVKLSEFGTFRTYLEYCAKDSELVYRLFEKETVLSFLVERANFTSLNVVQSLHFGNSRYLVELFKTYGTRLGYFFNPSYFEGGDRSHSKYRFVLGKDGKYQGALNYCLPERVYRDVAVMDFSSMYPSTLLDGNLCYGTCTVMKRQDWLACPPAQSLTSIPFRRHSDADFSTDPGDDGTTRTSFPSTSSSTTTTFSYPTFDPERDEYAMVIHSETEAAFLPRIVKHFITTRRIHRREWDETGDVYHYNAQLAIKILINSLYGVMASKNSPLSYLPIAVIVTTLSRYQLLASYHFIRRRGYTVCYADTDSLMVHRWPDDHCDAVNRFLNLPHVELEYEERMKNLLVLSKKRYVYRRARDDRIVTKGFAKKINGLVEYMSRRILESVVRVLFEGRREAATADDGWILWVDLMQTASYMCRDPTRYSVYRKLRPAEEYKSTTCPAVLYMAKYPEKVGEYVEYTYARADVGASKALRWIVDAEDCRCVHFEKLFTNQKKFFVLLLNATFWHSKHAEEMCDQVSNAIRWKKFVHAELKHWHVTGKRLILLVEPGVKYTFRINDHVVKEKRVGRARKRKSNTSQAFAREVKKSRPS